MAASSQDYFMCVWRIVFLLLISKAMMPCRFNVSSHILLVMDISGKTHD